MISTIRGQPLEEYVFRIPYSVFQILNFQAFVHFLLYVFHQDYLVDLVLSGNFKEKQKDKIQKRFISFLDNPYSFWQQTQNCGYFSYPPQHHHHHQHIHSYFTHFIKHTYKTFYTFCT